MTRRPRVPKFIWESAYLDNLANELGDECILLCLSPVSFRMLIDMSKMLLWATRYDTEDVPQIGHVAYREMNVPCTNELLTRLSGIEAALEELNNMNITITQTNACDGGTVDGGGVCYGTDGSPIVTLPPIAPPPEIPPLFSAPLDPTNPIPSELPDENWEEYDARACTIANTMWFLVNYTLAWLEAVIDIGFIVAAILSTLLVVLPAGLAGALGLATLYEVALVIIDLLKKEAVSDILNAMRAYWQAEKEDVICGLYDLRHDTNGLYGEFFTRIGEMIASVVFDSPASPYLMNKIFKLLAPAWLIYKWIEGESFPAFDGEFIDCSQCAEEVVSEYKFFNDWLKSLKGDDGVDVDRVLDYVVYGKVYVAESGDESYEQKISFGIGDRDTRTKHNVVMTVLEVSAAFDGHNAGSSENGGCKFSIVDEDNVRVHCEPHDLLPPSTGQMPTGSGFSWNGNSPGINDTYTVRFVINPV